MVVAASGGTITGAAAMRWVKKAWGAAIEAMPPLPVGATWRQQWLYQALKAVATPAKAGAAGNGGAS